MKKNYVPCLFLVFLLFACEGENQSPTIEDSLLGTWQLSETFFSIGGGPGSWKKVEDGITYTFESNGLFRTTKFEDCSSGQYIVDGDKIRMKYDCGNPLPDFANADGELVEQFKFIGKHLHINPTYVFCVEPCDNRYLRVE